MNEFNNEQLRSVRYGKSKNVNPRFYAKPALTAEEMKCIINEICDGTFVYGFQHYSDEINERISKLKEQYDFYNDSNFTTDCVRLLELYREEFGYLNSPDGLSSDSIFGKQVELDDNGDVVYCFTSKDGNYGRFTTKQLEFLNSNSYHPNISYVSNPNIPAFKMPYWLNVGDSRISNIKLFPDQVKYLVASDLDYLDKLNPLWGEHLTYIMLKGLREGKDLTNEGYDCYEVSKMLSEPVESKFHAELHNFVEKYSLDKRIYKLKETTLQFVLLGFIFGLNVEDIAIPGIGSEGSEIQFIKALGCEGKVGKFYEGLNSAKSDLLFKQNTSSNNTGFKKAQKMSLF